VRLSPYLALLSGSIWIAWILFHPPLYVTYQGKKYPLALALDLKDAPHLRILSRLYPTPDFYTALLHSLGVAVITGMAFYLLRKVSQTGNPANIKHGLIMGAEKASMERTEPSENPGGEQGKQVTTSEVRQMDQELKRKQRDEAYLAVLKGVTASTLEKMPPIVSIPSIETVSSPKPEQEDTKK